MRGDVGWVKKTERLIEARLLDTPIDEGPINLTGETSINLSENSNEIPASANNQSWFLLYDFGEIINGMPQLDIEGTAGTEVQIVTAPLLKGSFISLFPSRYNSNG